MVGIRLSVNGVRHEDAVEARLLLVTIFATRSA